MPDPPVWTRSAQADLLQIDQQTALGILRAIAGYLESQQGDVRGLSGRWAGYRRLRVGEWRVVFRELLHHRIEIIRIRHRSEAYR